MDFIVSASPSPDVLLSRYDAMSYPKFRVIFETPPTDGPLPFLAQPAEDATRAGVMESRCDKDVTAMRYRWVTTSEDGKTSRRAVSSDSYMVDVYYPVLKAQDCKLITPATSVDESLIEHIVRGGVHR